MKQSDLKRPQYSKALIKYINRYAEPCARLEAHVDSQNMQSLLPTIEPFSYSRALVIPAFDETDIFIDRLCHHPNVEDSLVVAVINCPQSKLDSEAGVRTQKLFKQLTHRGTMIFANHFFYIARVPLDSNKGVFTLWLINCCTEDRSIADRYGVGLARKMGADLALSLYQHGLISDSFFYSTDADASLPDNYFSLTKSDHDSAAIHFNFVHTPSDTYAQAQSHYDLLLDYYVAGLSFASSPYNHYALGSAIAIRYDAYSKVRGFPRRAAGEDFHMLNKLAKIGPVVFKQNICVGLETRVSNRVPFGTGPAVNGLAMTDNLPDRQGYYHPHCFELLKEWLRISQHYLHGHQLHSIDSIISNTIHNSDDRQILAQAIQRIGATSVLKEIDLHYSSTEQRNYQWKIRFDAIKTLRFIHALRDSGAGRCSATEAQHWLQKNKIYNPRTGLALWTI